MYTYEKKWSRGAKTTFDGERGQHFLSVALENYRSLTSYPIRWVSNALERPFYWIILKKRFKQR